MKQHLDLEEREDTDVGSVEDMEAYVMDIPESDEDLPNKGISHNIKHVVVADLHYNLFQQGKMQYHSFLPVSL